MCQILMFKPLPVGTKLGLYDAWLSYQQWTAFVGEDSTVILVSQFWFRLVLTEKQFTGSLALGKLARLD